MMDIEEVKRRILDFDKIWNEKKDHYFSQINTITRHREDGALIYSITYHGDPLISIRPVVPYRSQLEFYITLHTRTLYYDRCDIVYILDTSEIKMRKIGAVFCSAEIKDGFPSIGTFYFCDEKHDFTLNKFLGICLLQSLRKFLSYYQENGIFEYFDIEFVDLSVQTFTKDKKTIAKYVLRGMSEEKIAERKMSRFFANFINFGY